MALPVVREAAQSLGLAVPTVHEGGRRWFPGVVVRWAAALVIAAAGASGYGTAFAPSEPIGPAGAVFSPVRTDVCVGALSDRDAAQERDEPSESSTAVASQRS